MRSPLRFFMRTKDKDEGKKKGEKGPADQNICTQKYFPAKKSDLMILKFSEINSLNKPLL